jgi:CheY-like chemotaxis protein
VTKTILLVQENADLVSDLSKILASRGEFAVVTTATGVMGLEQACRIHPDCLVIDVQSAELNGYQVAQALRGDPETARIPLILLGTSSSENQVRAMAVGADRYLTKPIDPDEFIAALEWVIAREEIDRVIQLSQLAKCEVLNAFNS